MLTAETVLSLGRVLVKNNPMIQAVHWEQGFRGKGNSNTSGYTAGAIQVMEIEQRSGQPIQYLQPFAKYQTQYPFQFAIAAVVEDVVYCIVRHTYTQRCNVVQITADTPYCLYTDIAYDTLGCCYLTVL